MSTVVDGWGTARWAGPARVQRAESKSVTLRWVIALLLCAWSTQPFKLSAQTADSVRHVKVYSVPGRFGGWPANHGVWSWGNEVLVGFSAGYYKDLGPNRHHIDHDKPEEHLLARSRDGGETWSIENPAIDGALIPAGPALHGVAPPGSTEKPWQDCPGGINFAHPDFALTLRMTDVNAGASRFYYSTNRGHRWAGPFSPAPVWPARSSRPHRLSRQQPDGLPALSHRSEGIRPRRPSFLRFNRGQWENLEVCLLDWPGAEGICHHAIDGAGWRSGTSLRHPLPRRG
jgi:hypothetical protein